MDFLKAVLCSLYVWITLVACLRSPKLLRYNFTTLCHPALTDKNLLWDIGKNIPCLHTDEHLRCIGYCQSITWTKFYCFLIDSYLENWQMTFRSLVSLSSLAHEKGLVHWVGQSCFIYNQALFGIELEGCLTLPDPLGLPFSVQ